MKKFTWIATIVVVLSLVLPWAAFADDVVNSVDATVDATVEVLGLNFPGNSGSVGLWINPTGTTQNPDDGKSGCNLTGQTTLTITVANSDSSIATVSPTSITFTSCNETPTTATTLTVTPLKGGTTHVTFSVTSNTTNGTTFDLGPAAFDVKVTSPDSTLPVITPTIVGTLGNNGWYTSDVTVSWSVVDYESAITSQSGCDSTTINYDTAGVTLTCTATSAGGTTSKSVTIKRDATPPTITYTGRTTANTFGWNNSDVTVNWSCADAMSGPVNASVSKTISVEGENQSARGTCEDNAGNTASNTQTGINIDKTAPVITLHVTDSDLCSALSTPPSYDVDASISGLDAGSESVTGGTASGVGSFTYSVIATDKAGNQATKSAEYKVTYGTAFSGYLQPIDQDGSSRFKLGSTVPVKFQLMCGTTPIANAVAKMYVAKGDSVADPGVDEAISTAAATTGNLFRYDMTAQQYIFNLSTKLGYTNPGSTTPVSFSTGTWTLKIGLDDGTYKSVNIQLPK